MAETITIGCRLMHGLSIRLKGDKVGKAGVTLNGLSSLKIRDEQGRPVGTHATTEVDLSFWTKWKSENLNFKPLKSNAIFEAKTLRDAEDKGKELAREKTGFEPLIPKEHKVQDVDKKEDE